MVNCSLEGWMKGDEVKESSILAVGCKLASIEEDRRRHISYIIVWASNLLVLNFGDIH